MRKLMIKSAEIDLELLCAGDRRTLAKTITLVESRLDSHRDEAKVILDSLLPSTGQSIRIGITGPPGVGKSTFIEAFGLHLISCGKKVAVLAVDPSSPVAGGSILADKTRMETLSRHDSAFIRPSPSEGALGGVAQKTRESMLLCEAAGYNVVLIETVGVGQSEYEVAGMVDFFMVLLLPNAGDEIQGLKKGIIELSDALIINKADGDFLNLAERTRLHYQNALQLLRHPTQWTPRVMTCSSLESQNIDKIWKMIREYQLETSQAQGHNCNPFYEKRSQQNRDWLHNLMHEMLLQKLHQNSQVQEQLPNLEQQVITGGITPYTAAKRIIDFL